MNNLTWVLQIEEALERGETRLVCPTCGGGNTGERSMAVWEGRDGALMATCYRANCDFGTRPVRRSMRSNEKIAHRRTARDYSQLQDELTDDDCVEFNSLQAFQYRPRTLKEWVRKVWRGWSFPQWNEGLLAGCVVRNTTNDGGPKSLTFRYDTKWDGMGWYVCNASAPLRIVEDPRSALALYDSGSASVSLNGTALGYERYESLRKTGRSLILMLDADATERALAYRLRYGTGLEVRRLSRDVKNMTREEVAKLVKE